MNAVALPRLIGGSVLACAALLAACVPASDINPVDKLSAVPSGHTVLVGRVELYPALRPGEQELSDSHKEYANKALLIVGNELRPVPELTYGDLSERIDAPFDQWFFVELPAQPTYILKGWVIMHAKVKVLGPTAQIPDPAAPLEGVFKLNLEPGDQAVYIGTIKYYRNEFFDVDKVVVKDDYAVANTEFQRRFGRQATLRKRLAVPVKAPE